MLADSLIKRFLPRSLLGRSLLIIVTPLVLVQVVAALVFFESHWDKVTLRLARGLAGDIAVLATLLREDPTEAGVVRMVRIAADHMQIGAAYRPGEILTNIQPAGSNRDERNIAQAMREFLARPYRLDTGYQEENIRIEVQMPDGVLDAVTTRKRLYSSTTYVFLMWMVGISMILFGVAVIFMRNQVKPIRRLAQATDSFGKGREAPPFKVEGAIEVRQAAAAFMAMRNRIQRQIRQRTEMLAGVSHDLRTPLTRMKLQLALIGDNDGTAELRQDVADMERMLEGYLAFARGEGTEKPSPTDLNGLLDDVVARARRGGNGIDLHCEGNITVPLRPDAFRRCMTNLIENAARYAQHVSVRAGVRGETVEIIVDDDGPGIDPDKREDVFRPFFRLDGSRNPGTGGVGLGLTIARDVARSHGGDVELADSPTGGLRARVRVPT